MFDAIGAAPTREELVYGQLRQAIIERRLEPGQEVVVTTVAAQMGVSRMPVMTACKRLIGEGLLVANPRRRVTVAALTAERIVEGTEVLLALEYVALEHLVERVTDADLARWEQLNRAVRRFTRPPGSLSPNVPDERFHAALWEAAGRPYLLQQLQLVYDHNQPARALQHRRPDPEQSAAEHEEILAALRRRDVAGAKDALRRHRDRGTAIQIDVLRSAS
ncbi:MAG TPA: GntR family transcriptional regulator [Chloroflexota bacterium]|nr:GntR family transcriptional regulator [Chloroflexota bacterium]